MSKEKLMEETEDLCELKADVVNENMVRHVKEEMLDHETVDGLAELFKALADPTRLKIIYALKQSELCVCDISAVLNMGQSAVSHQLRYLRNLRLVKRRKEGKMMFYSIDDQHIDDLFSQGLIHISHK